MTLYSHSHYIVHVLRIYKRDWYSVYTLQSFVLDDYRRVWKQTILWSKTKARCDWRRAFYNCGNLTGVSLEEGKEAFSTTAGSKRCILGFTLEAVAHSTRFEGTESTEQTNGQFCENWDYTQIGPKWRVGYFRELFISVKAFRQTRWSRSSWSQRGKFSLDDV